MSYSSCLADTKGDLLLDASVLINLSASGAAAEVLAALPLRALIVDIAASEVNVDDRTKRSDGDALQELLKSQSLSQVVLNEPGLLLFEALVRVLDDGEAATIAAATASRGIAVVDEKRARRICGDEVPESVLASTVDLFAHPAVEANLGRERLAEVVHAALQKARMHVRQDQREWIVGLIGEERAAGCSSIPNAPS